MIKTFKECDDHSCLNFDPESQHGHFEYKIEAGDVGRMVGECQLNAMDIRTMYVEFKIRQNTWRVTTGLLERLGGILGIPKDPSIDSVEFIKAAKRLVSERNEFKRLWNGSTGKSKLDTSARPSIK